MITYIVAGNRQEYMDYQRDYRKVYHYVRSAEDFIGTVNPHGFFIGTWRDRPDIEEIKLAIKERQRY